MADIPVTSPIEPAVEEVVGKIESKEPIETTETESSADKPDETQVEEKEAGEEKEKEQVEAVVEPAGNEKVDDGQIDDSAVEKETGNGLVPEVRAPDGDDTEGDEDESKSEAVVTADTDEHTDGNVEVEVEAKMEVPSSTDPVDSETLNDVEKEPIVPTMLEDLDEDGDDCLPRGGRESSLPGSRGMVNGGDERDFDGVEDSGAGGNDGDHEVPQKQDEAQADVEKDSEKGTEVTDASLIEVELSVLPEQYVHRQRWPGPTTAETVLNDVAKLLGLARETLSLYTIASSSSTASETEPDVVNNSTGVLLEADGTKTASTSSERMLVSNSMTVSSLDPSKVGKITLELVVDTVRPLKLLRKGENNTLLQGQMKVEVDLGNEAKPKHLIVVIERDENACKKEYLGGYRNKKTGAIYHHATVQTDNDDDKNNKSNKVVSSTQTYRMVTATIQTGREASTQMKRPDLMIDESMDFTLIPGTYVTSEEYMRMKLESIIVIQCHARGYLARKLARRLRHEKIEADLAAENERQLKLYELERRRKFEIERRMNPKSHEDFTILRKELEAWKAQELMMIRTDQNDEEDRHQRMLALLNKETKLLQTIDRLKIHAASDNRDIRIATMLSEMSQPKDWGLKDGDTIEVHTPFTIRARELMQLYNALRLPLLTMDERLDVLLHVKWTVKEFDCNLTREIVSLVDREADLLNRGRDVQKLINLRKRIANLFLEFIETPEFNPEAERFRLLK